MVWVNEAYQTVYPTVLGHIPAQQHFLDRVLLELDVSISDIGCGCLTTIEKSDFRVDAAVSGVLSFHIIQGSRVGVHLH